jgi:hypothetical protein
VEVLSRRWGHRDSRVVKGRAFDVCRSGPGMGPPRHDALLDASRRCLTRSRNRAVSHRPHALRQSNPLSSSPGVRRGMGIRVGPTSGAGAGGQCLAGSPGHVGRRVHLHERLGGQPERAGHDKHAGELHDHHGLHDAARHAPGVPAGLHDDRLLSGQERRLWIPLKRALGPFCRRWRRPPNRL